MRVKSGSGLVAALLLTAASGLAHHSFVMFDTSKQITLTGSVTSFEWTNPHVYIEIDVPDETGATKHWSIELGSPSILRSGGWTHKTLAAGQKVTLIINPLKNGNPGGLLVQANLPDNRKLGNGPGREAR
ncbi:MAG TPA: DUF6152 family protein [Bryobacteraceae bacterium]|jgi:hypothetical protein